MPYCSKCGRETNALGKSRLGICPSCGLVDLSATPIQGEPSPEVSVIAPIPPPTIPAEEGAKPEAKPEAKPKAKPRRNIIIAIALTIILLIVGGLGYGAYEMSKPLSGTPAPTTSLPTPSSSPTPTYTPTSKPTVIRIRETFTMEKAYEGIPVEIVFVSVWFTLTHEYYKAVEGNKFLVLMIQAKNIGTEETECFSTARWEVTVDKGQIYPERSCNLSATMVRPEETKTGYVFFEISTTTSPSEVRYYDDNSANDPTFTLVLRGESIPELPTAKDAIIRYTERYAEEIGFNSVRYKPAKNYTFLIVTLNIENIGDREFSTSPLYFRARVNGIEYDVHSATQSLSGPMKTVDLRSGEGISGRIAFEVPRETTSYELVYKGLDHFEIEWAHY